MNTVELIRKKRDGQSLSADEINFLIIQYTKGKIPDYQISAFLMAVFFKGMNKTETANLTKAMLYSGEVLDLSHITGLKVDKHSTGGVGDKTSLIIAPIAAAAGVHVPMISGRALGHTGGTLDKLESIPGFKTNISIQQFKDFLKASGVVLAGQTSEIAPADKLIYALRDVTATVESVPLITASIMSKKLAEGIDGLVLDVKTGSGAFMKAQKDSVTLAQSLINTAKAFDKKVIAFITDMNQPLGNYIGNWLEVYESIKILQGENIPDLLELSLELAAAMIMFGGKAKTIKEGKDIAKQMIKNGKAFDKFYEIVLRHRGNEFFVKHPDKYPACRHTEKIYLAKTGYIKSIDNYEIGMSALELGAGRITKTDKIDPAAGIIFYSKIGDKVTKNTLIAEIFTDKENKIDEVKKRIINAVTLSSAKVAKVKLIKKVMN